MVNEVQNTYNYNGNTYRRRTRTEAEIGTVVASVATAIMYGVLPSFSNPFINQIKKEHSNNHLYKDSFFRAVEKSGLKEKGLKICHYDFLPSDATIPKEQIQFYDVKQGLNAFFNPETKEIALNTNKASITGFHELGHAMNNMSGKFGKILQKLRKPGYTLAGIMGTIAIINRTKPKEAPKNLLDKIQDNCAWIAVVGMLPTVMEEALASHNGIKMAKTVGLSEPLVKNLKKFYGKALLSYIGYAAVTGLSVYVLNKITDFFTRPQKVQTTEYHN